MFLHRFHCFTKFTKVLRSFKALRRFDKALDSYNGLTTFTPSWQTFGTSRGFNNVLAVYKVFTILFNFTRLWRHLQSFTKFTNLLQRFQFILRPWAARSRRASKIGALGCPHLSTPQQNLWSSPLDVVCRQ